MATDEVQAVLDVLNTEWSSSNTDNIKPTFQNLRDDNPNVFTKRIDARMNDAVVGYLTSDNVLPFGLGTVERETCVISLRTMTSQGNSHSLNIRDEILRIIQAKKIWSGTKFNTAQSVFIKDNNDRDRKLYGFTIDLKMEDFIR